MVGALQCEFMRDPVLLLRNRAPISTPPPPPQQCSQAGLLGTALETGAPLAGVLLYQFADGDVSVLQQSVQVLSVSSTQQELAVVEEA